MTGNNETCNATVVVDDRPEAFNILYGILYEAGIKFSADGGEALDGNGHEARLNNVTCDRTRLEKLLESEGFTIREDGEAISEASKG